MGYLLFFLLCILHINCTGSVTKNTASEQIITTQHKGITIVELFTSQGCSSCPPADALMHQLADKYRAEKIVFLSWHVDYWNYLGWKDIFSRPAWSERQRQLASRVAGGQVYTPQVFVDAGVACVGSSAREVEAYINQSFKTGMIRELVFTKSGELLITDSLSLDGLELSILLMQQEASVTIKRGENKDREIDYYHIVIEEFRPAGIAHTAAIVLPESCRDLDDDQYLVVLVTDPATRRYVAAGLVH